MDREKFQQKVLKQTKQKKSKSAEFLMAKEDEGVAEGLSNPALNRSRPNLSACQTAEKRVIRHDMAHYTLAARQRQLRLLTSAEPKAPQQVDDGILYNQLMYLLGDNGRGDPQDDSIREEALGDEVLRGSSTGDDLPREPEIATPSYTEEFERDAHKAMVLRNRASLQQDLKFEGEGLNQYIPMSSLKTDKIFGRAQSQALTADLTACEEDTGARLSKRPEATKARKAAAGLCGQVELQSLQPLQMQIKCLRGIKDKVPQGSYQLQVSLLGGLGGCVSPGWTAEQPKTRTHSIRHDGNFYDVGLYFHENLYMKFPAKKDVKPGTAFLFELFLVHGTYAGLGQAVAWGAFPLCNNNFDIVEGKFKCPLLRGVYDQRFDNFRTIEDLICLDLDCWLCNLYFQVIKLPVHLDDQKKLERQVQLSPEFPVCFMTDEKAEADVENMADFEEEDANKNTCISMDGHGRSLAPFSQGSIADKIGPCPMECDLSLLKEDCDFHYKEKSTSGRSGDVEVYSQDVPYLEELEEHRYSVCCPAADVRGSGKFSKHLHFVLVSVFSELQLAEWQSQGFWFILLLMACLWFLRLYLHYFGQWLFLRAISAPVTKFHFYPHTVELCYPASSLRISEELPVVVAGPLTLNLAVLLLVLIRWGCQLLFAFCPDVLSKLIIAMGLWTLLDPLAVFIVDSILGRLTQNGAAPVADAMKLYWTFARAMQPGILGGIITVLVYSLLLIISSLILYSYGLRLHSDSRILDTFQRIHSEETKFFTPYDLEISNQELSYIVKRSQQWRGISGERRKVAVYDYIWKRHGSKATVSGGDLQYQNEASVSALSPGDATSHVSIYTVYPSGFQELYRHFLRLPGGAIVEVLGDISGMKFVHSDMIIAIQEQINTMDTALEDSLDTNSREMRNNPLK